MMWKRCVIFVLLLLAPCAASAQTMSFEQASRILLDSCGSDIERYCRNVNLGSGRLKNCLATNQARVSAQCKSDYVRVFDGVQKRALARVSVLKICDADARRLCGMVQKGDGQVLECMLTASRGVSPRCSQAITDAGYRQ
jgi:hypothetical protein